LISQWDDFDQSLKVTVLQRLHRGGNILAANPPLLHNNKKMGPN
jgi:hypothetical protein